MLGWESPTKGHQGLSQGGMKQESWVEHPWGHWFYWEASSRAGTLQVTLRRAPMCREGVPPTPLNPGAGCHSRADVSSRFWVKFPTRLERSGALERAGCRCHSWVIQEINWGLGWEAASKRTLRSDLPLAPVRSQCQKLREMLLGGARHPSHQHPQPSVTSQQTCPREGPPQPSTPRSPWKKNPKKTKNQTKSKL